MKSYEIKKTVSRAWLFSSKILLVMKLTIFLLIVATLQVRATGYGQKINLSEHNVKLEKVFKEITNQSGYHFFYEDALIQQTKKIDVNIKNAGIEEALDICLKDQQLSYVIVDKTIAIKHKIEAFIQPLPPPPLIEIKGKVLDENGAAISGATILIKGTQKAAISDENGNFFLRVIDKKIVLIVSYTGYKTQEITLHNRIEINVQLEIEVKALDDVVIVGYGTQKKATLSGSISTVKGNDIASVPVANVTNMLAGRVPGLIAYSNSSEPGNDKANLLIRGQNTLGDNSPLIVVDGIANRGFEHIDPNDIESLSVLKDASAAIYGAQAANGVILITTKRGKIGKPMIFLTLNEGFNSPTRLPKLADAYNYASMVNDIYPNTYSTDAVKKFQDGTDPLHYPNTDWYKATIKTWSVQKNANFTVNGGSENLKYLVSFGAKYNDGVYKSSASNYTQYNFRTNIDGKINKFINIAFDVAGRQENINSPSSDIATVFRSIIRGRPTMVAIWPTGEPGPATEGGAQSVIITTDQPGYNHKINYILESNFRLNVAVPWVEGLSLSTNASIDKNFSNQKGWSVPYNLYNWNGTTLNANNQPVLTLAKYGPPLPGLGQSFSDGKNITLNALLNYEVRINNKHNIKIMAGSERHTYNNSWLSANRGNFLSPVLSQMFAGARDLLMTNDGSEESNARLNYFGRVNYNFSSKYLLEFVWRYDGSYKFPVNSQFGFFPGISLGYRISEEAFFKNNVPFINNLKLRGSWGQTGNDRINDYQFLSTYAFNNYPAVFGSTPALYQALYENVIPNKNITWELADQRNIGLEGAVLNNKLSFEFDYFNNYRTQILIQRNASIPAMAGLTLPPENFGKVSNAGFDGSVTYQDKIGDFRFHFSVNMTHNKNKIVFWDETPGIDKWQQTTGNTIGGDLYYQANGIFHTQADANEFNAKYKGGVIPNSGVVPGDIRFIDVNNDGIIDGRDRVRDFKSQIPTLTGGININVGYKSFDLGVLFQGASGAVTYVDNSEAGLMGNYLKEYADKRWTTANANSEYPRTWDRTNMYWTLNRNTFWLRSTDYIRLKSIELGYSASKQINKKLGINSLRIYANGFNLFTVDKLGIYDPEGAAANGQFYIYPMNKALNAGIKVTF